MKAINNDRKHTDVLRIPRRTIEAPQVPHEQGAEKSLHQKRVVQDASTNDRLLTPVVSTVETCCETHSLARQMVAYMCLKKLARIIEEMECPE